MPLQFTGCSFGYHRRRRVLDALDCLMPKGRTVFLGPNGAGKSTVLGLAASALRPRSGTVSYRGIDSTDPRSLKKYRRRVAWLPQDVESVPGLTARQQVAYVGWLKGMSRSAAWDESLRALRKVELARQSRIPVDRLSGGQRRRVGVAQSLVHGAEVLLLDEPTAGMDPRQRRVFHDVLGALPASVHVVLSTHDTADLDTAYDNVLVLVSGEIVFGGRVREFLHHAPVGTAVGRRAEAAYETLTERTGRWDS
ncbi:ATP-binding cassette domain-containing protein [Streptomyces corynorhini]|uniref:ATP-binding cassette domain-containing protein n=1 Tax=Streptomyces corynorhini TaxID=2282652 RepID=A0A370B2I0_9ACTN|nr:ATP-binding cassette domain-containing protein [Streptomyces corynorhini]RDG36040.1 ATP-binding cassette domain-containing protein [Streptomyces corynorhini]